MAVPETPKGDDLLNSQVGPAGEEAAHIQGRGALAALSFGAVTARARGAEKLSAEHQRFLGDGQRAVRGRDGAGGHFFPAGEEC
ncbi:MAG: hypothetical protein IPN59_13290 [Holophaga sp.]|nr:hypothetical protein [Holophaga sp.]